MKVAICHTAVAGAASKVPHARCRLLPMPRRLPSRGRFDLTAAGLGDQDRKTTRAAMPIAEEAPPAKRLFELGFPYANLLAGRALR